METTVTLNEGRIFREIGGKTVEVLEKVNDKEFGQIQVFIINDELCIYNEDIQLFGEEHVKTCSFTKALDEFPILLGVEESGQWAVKCGMKEFLTGNPLESAIKEM